MAFIQNRVNNQGMFVPESVIYDTQQIGSVDVNSKEFKDLLVRLYQSINNISINLNKKEIGLYPIQELVTGKLYYQNQPTPFVRTGFLPTDNNSLRTIYRTTYITGAIGAGATTIAHNLPIDANWEFTEIYGVANDNVGNNYYPMPTTNLTLVVNLTNIVITNGTGINFTSGSVVLEYAKIF